MTAEEAIEELRNRVYLYRKKWLGDHYEMERYLETYEVAIEALEEVERYRALGTVEELKEAKEKQIPKKPENWSIEEMFCPSCNKGLAMAEDTTYLFREVLPRHCEHCGQAIDWGEEE